MYDRYPDAVERATTMSGLPDGDANLGGWRAAGFFPTTCRSRVGLQQKSRQTVQEFISPPQGAKAKVSYTQSLDPSALIWISFFKGNDDKRKKKIRDRCRLRVVFFDFKEPKHNKL